MTDSTGQTVDRSALTPPAQPLRVVGVLSADYHQIELHPGSGGRVVTGPGGTLAVGLAEVFGDDDAPVALTVPIRWGEIETEVEVRHAPPGDPDGVECAVELSIVVGEHPSMTGWAGMGDVLPIALTPGTEVRVRHVVEHGQAAADADLDDGGRSLARSVVQIWPAVAAPAKVVADEVSWSRFWTAPKA